MSVLLDLSNLCAACMHVQKTKDIGIVRHTVINSILTTKIAHGNKFGNLIIATDMKPYWRSEIFPYYKAHRIPDQELRKIIDVLKVEIHETFPYKVISVPGAEADDIIAVAALNTTEPTLIRANDGDFHQLLRNPLVKMYRPAVQKWVDELPLDQIEWELFLKIAKGDKGDGIPNSFNPGNCFVNGIKQKTLRETVVADWYKSGIPDQYRGRFFENKKLIDLREIPEHIVSSINAELVKEPIGSKSKIYQYLVKSNLNKLANTFLEDLNRF